MNSKITYNLSNIPGFDTLIKTKEISPDFEKYYRLQQYSTKVTDKYSIIKYNKEFMCSDLVRLYGLLRSVILSDSKVVCFSPPKSLSGENFITSYPVKPEHIIAEEFIEGTMINAFFDPTGEKNGCWEIATRNTVGADVSFYKSSTLTFKQMFKEACIYNNFDINTLNRKYCYSFVLQHPSNRIVVPFIKLQLYLVAVYEIIQKNETVIVVEENLSDVIEGGLWGSVGVKFPNKYNFSTYTELIDKFASGNTPYDIMGVVVKNTQTGERTKFRNPIYEEVRQLRGNQPKLQYQYLCLRHSGKLPEFLKYYPETKEDMSQFRDQVHMFTKNLHKNYISCYVKKEKPLRDYTEQYRTHMFKLHEHFLSNLRENGHYITNTEVIKYVNNLHPSLLMYCLNFTMRKRMIDTMKPQTHI